MREWSGRGRGDGEKNYPGLRANWGEKKKPRKSRHTGRKFSFG